MLQNVCIKAPYTFVDKVVSSWYNVIEVIYMQSITKVCTKCGIEKNLDEFNNQKAGKYGKRANCRECQNAENRAYKQTEKAKELRSKWKKSEKGRACEKRYRENNKEIIRAKCRTEEYRARHRISADNQRFSGNREKALERDNYKCVVCGSKTLLQVHHKDEMGRNKPKEEQNNDLDNLITLCASCHIKKHNPVLKRWGKI